MNILVCLLEIFNSDDDNKISKSNSSQIHILKTVSTRMEGRGSGRTQAVMISKVSQTDSIPISPAVLTLLAIPKLKMTFYKKIHWYQ